MTSPMPTVKSPRCEYRVDPLGIDERSPRLSWALESEARGARQSAYRVLVARGEEDLGAEQNLLWDSGRVESDRTSGVEYGGELLRSGTRCVWKVRLWNGGGDPSPYSEAAAFEMGLLERSDWKGDWIFAGGADKDFEPPTGDEYDDLANGLAPSSYLRRGFSLDGPVRRARLYSTARGIYEVSINGTRIGEDVLAPGWTDYDRRIKYQTYDVTPLLAEGQNALGAVLGDGWYAGFFGFDPKRRGALYGSKPQLLAQLHVEYEDGTTHTIATDDSWRCSTGPILHSDLLMDGGGRLPVAEHELFQPLLVGLGGRMALPLRGGDRPRGARLRPRRHQPASGRRSDFRQRRVRFGAG
jgi:alpha-L-rhamnosidase